MNDRSLGADELSGVEWADLRCGPIRPDPIHDGSQAVAHDGYDVQMFADALQSYERLAGVLDRASQPLVTAPALYRDLFWSFYQRAVVAEPPVPLQAAYMINQQIVQEIMSTSE